MYNVQNKGGFVIVSPDDETETILGYSDSGSIAPENIPENMKAWLQGYAEEISFLRGTRYEVRGAEEVRGAASRSNIAPLVLTHWDQFEPYNNYCPAEGSSNCVTGCVATAMSQIMYSHQHPYATIKEIPSYTTSSKGYVRPAIPAGSTINWSNMLLAYGWYNFDGSGWVQGTYNSTQADAVAQLMMMCGTAVHMNYSGNSSGGRSELIVPAFIKYFDYEPQTVQRVLRSNYSDSQWTDIIYHELANGRPMVYSGVTSSNAGHSFIVDGYQTGDYFHVNWGWSTVGADGYYLLSAMIPKNTSYDFNYGHDAVIGIQPTGQGGTVSPQVSQANGTNIRLIDVQWSENPVKPGSQVTIKATLQNNSATTYDKGFAFIPSTENMFNGSDFGDVSTLTSGEVKVVSKTITAPSTEGEITYAIIYNRDGSWYKDEGLTTDPLIVSNSATGISRTTVNGQQPTDAYYDLSGRRVMNPTKGIFIYQGKKVIR